MFPLVLYTQSANYFNLLIESTKKVGVALDIIRQRGYGGSNSCRPDDFRLERDGRLRIHFGAELMGRDDRNRTADDALCHAMTECDRAFWTVKEIEDFAENPEQSRILHRAMWEQGFRPNKREAGSWVRFPNSERQNWEPEAPYTTDSPENVDWGCLLRPNFNLLGKNAKLDLDRCINLNATDQGMILGHSSWPHESAESQIFRQNFGNVLCISNRQLCFDLTARRIKTVHPSGKDAYYLQVDLRANGRECRATLPTIFENNLQLFQLAEKIVTLARHTGWPSLFPSPYVAKRY